MASTSYRVEYVRKFSYPTLIKSCYLLLVDLKVQKRSFPVAFNDAFQFPPPPPQIPKPNGCGTREAFTREQQVISVFSVFLCSPICGFRTASNWAIG